MALFYRGDGGWAGLDKVADAAGRTKNSVAVGWIRALFLDGRTPKNLQQTPSVSSRITCNTGTLKKMRRCWVIREEPTS